MIDNSVGVWFLGNDSQSRRVAREQQHRLRKPGMVCPSPAATQSPWRTQPSLRDLAQLTSDLEAVRRIPAVASLGNVRGSRWGKRRRAELSHPCSTPLLPIPQEAAAPRWAGALPINGASSAPSRLGHPSCGASAMREFSPRPQTLPPQTSGCRTPVSVGPLECAQPCVCWHHGHRRRAPIAPARRDALRLLRTGNGHGAAVLMARMRDVRDLYNRLGRVNRGRPGTDGRHRALRHSVQHGDNLAAADPGITLRVRRHPCRQRIPRPAPGAECGGRGARSGLSAVKDMFVDLYRDRHRRLGAVAPIRQMGLATSAGSLWPGRAR